MSRNSKKEKGETSKVGSCEDGQTAEKKCKKEYSEEDDDVDDLRNENNVLTAELRQCKNELKEARQAFINGLENLLPTSCEIKVKHMGEIDDKPFLDAYAAKYSNEPQKIVKHAVSTLSRWQKKISDPHWHPFYVCIVAGEPKEVLNNNDSTLKRLRKNHGNGVYCAVVQALKEMNEYNSSGRYVVQELWNKSQNRKASLKEVINDVVTMIELPEEPRREKRARPCKGQ